MNGRRDWEVERICALLLVSQDIKKPVACSMLSELIFPELTASIKLYAISFITTLNTGTVLLMLQI